MLQRASSKVLPGRTESGDSLVNPSRNAGIKKGL